MLIITHEKMAEHDPGPGHPERPERLRALIRSLRQAKDLDLQWEEAAPTTREMIEWVHSPRHIDRIDALRGKSALVDLDTFISPASVDAAYLAAGAAVRAVDAVIGGEAESAFALVRPPGHHAESARAAGFCLFNNIALAAEHALVKGGLEQVLIIDWDVHHGNGTQEIFYPDPDAAYFSVHQSPHYPGTGHISEQGRGDGKGYTINVPLPAGADDAAFICAFRKVLVPFCEQVKPELILISAGFDAHVADPLSMTCVTERGFQKMAAIVADLARRFCDGRIVLVLEGGYDISALTASVRATIEGITRGAADDDPQPSPEHEALIERIRRHHERVWPSIGCRGLNEAERSEAQ